MRAHAHREGALDFIEKPVNLHALPETLRDICARPRKRNPQVGGLDVLEVSEFLAHAMETKVIRFRSAGNGGTLVFENGALVHATTGGLKGPDAFFEMSRWGEGSFEEVAGVETRGYEKNVDVNAEDLLKQAVLLLEGSNERTGHVAESTRPPARSALPAPATGDDPVDTTEGTLSVGVSVDDGSLSDTHHSGERSDEMAERSSTQVLDDLLKVPDVNAAVVVGRDGFVIETAGGSATLDIDNLGASLAHAVNGVEEMGTELEVKAFQDLYVEFGRAVIICRPVGDAVLALVTPDASKLGIVRHKSKKLVAELSQFF